MEIIITTVDDRSDRDDDKRTIVIREGKEVRISFEFPHCRMDPAEKDLVAGYVMALLLRNWV